MSIKCMVNLYGGLPKTHIGAIRRYTTSLATSKNMAMLIGSETLKKSYHFLNSDRAEGFKRTIPVTETVAFLKLQVNQVNARNRSTTVPLASLYWTTIKITAMVYKSFLIQTILRNKKSVLRLMSKTSTQ